MSSNKELDPLDPENDIFWDPELLKVPPLPPPKKTPADMLPPEEPYRLVAPAPTPSSSTSSAPMPNCSTTLKRAAGPTQPNKQVETKEPQLGETEAKKLKQTATAFGFGQESQKHQLEVQQATDGFRKLYVGALGPNTTERSLEQYFAQYGTVLVTQVLRERDTGMTKGFGFVTMQDPKDCHAILRQSVHVVDNRTIRVSLTHGAKSHSSYNWKPANPSKHEEKIALIHEVAQIEVREGRIYIGPLPDEVMPNSLAAQFSQYGIVAGSNVSRAANNTMKKNFGVVSYKETMPVKRVLQNPRHFVNEKYVDITLSKFGMEVLLSNTILWIWSLEWTVNNDDLVRYFQQFGSIFRAMHIFNPFTGEKKGYGFVDFVDFNVVKRCTHGGSNSKMFQIHGQQAWYGKFLPRNIKRDLMYLEDSVGNMLLKQLYQKVPDSGTWGGGQDHQATIKETGGAKTVTCKLPRNMLPVVVGEDGKIITEIARDSKTKITLVKSQPTEDVCLFHVVGTPATTKTAQYMMQIKIKEKMQKGNSHRYNR